MANYISRSLLSIYAIEVICNENVAWGLCISSAFDLPKHSFLCLSLAGQGLPLVLILALLPLLLHILRISDASKSFDRTLG